MNEAHICLLPKGRTGHEDPANYRPISLMNIWIKLIDKIINRRLVQHLEENGLLSDEQAGFRKGRSCTEQILTLELISQIQEQRQEETHI